MKMKKILASSLVLSAVLFASSSLVLASDIPQTPGNSILEESNSILRYAHISTFSPTLSSSGKIGVSLSLRTSYDYSITLELEQYIGGSWESIDSWYLDGNHRGTISESCSLESGERYRARAYVEAGVDGIMIHSRKREPDEIFTFCDRFRENDPRTPIVTVPTTYCDTYESELAAHGVNIVIYANQLTRSAFPAMEHTAETILRHHRAREAEDGLIPIKKIITLIDPL